MTEVKLGAATVQRIEESYEPNFDAKMFFPDWNPAVVQQHKDWLPCHFGAPFTCHVDHKGAGFAPRFDAKF